MIKVRQPGGMVIQYNNATGIKQCIGGVRIDDNRGNTQAVILDSGVVLDWVEPCAVWDSRKDDKRIDEITKELRSLKRKIVTKKKPR